MMPFPIPPMYTELRYKYVTPDGNVPCEGKAPTDRTPSFDTLAGVPSVTRPQLGYFGPGYGFGCPQAGPFPPGSWHCYQYYPSMPSPCQMLSPGQPIPPPSMPQHFPAPLPPPPPPPHRPSTVAVPFGQVNRNLEVIGARGNDSIPPADIIEFWLFDHNVIRMYPHVDDVLTIKDNRKKLRKVHRRARWEELIESVECKNRIMEHHSYYPDRLIGVQELIPLPGGRHEFKLGPKIMLSDRQAYEEVGEMWPLGYNQPRWLVRLPH